MRVARTWLTDLQRPDFASSKARSIAEAREGSDDDVHFMVIYECGDVYRECPRGTDLIVALTRLPLRPSVAQKRSGRGR